MPKNNLVIFGTRPEVIKLAPIIESIDCSVLNTGQHKELTDEAMSIFGIKPDYNLSLMEESQTPLDVMTSAIPQIEKIIKKEKPERIWVQGDTITVLSGALAGFFNGIEVVHLEAGLRSGNKNEPFPEEVIRRLVSKVADIHLCSTEKAVKNLKKEGITDDVYLVGNTVVDALEMINLPSRRSREKSYALITMHRREVIGEPLKKVFEAFKEISKKIDLVFPCHPNPKIRELAKDAGIKIVEPFNYKKMLHHIRDADFIMTDSGGIQEEAPSFNTPVIVLRRETERRELIDSEQGFLVGWDKDKIIKYANDIYDRKITTEKKNNPFGDGKSTERIKGYLEIE